VPIEKVARQTGRRASKQAPGKPFWGPPQLARQAPMHTPSFSVTYHEYKASRAGRYARLRPLRTHILGDPRLADVRRMWLIKFLASALGVRFVDHGDAATADVILLGGWYNRAQAEALLASNPRAVKMFWTRENADRHP
jgi:hypothetical protein